MKQIRKIYYIIPIVLLLLISFLFWGWFVLPKKSVDLLVVDKTVPASKIDRYNEIASDYRKHIGFFWLLNELRYHKPDGSPYDYKKDYYGPILGVNKQVTYQKLQTLSKTPQLIYLSDAFGDIDNPNTEYNGITYEDMAVVSTAHQNGAMLIGEFNITSEPTPDSVVSELGSIFGVSFSEWSGRYVYNLADKSDLPQWAMSLHEQQYGRPWDYTGEGMLLVSRSGEMVILQKGTDYSSDLFSIAVTEQYQKEFGKSKLNFYNWFQLIESDYDTQVIAEFSFRLNEDGKKKFSKISTKLSFPAVTRKASGTSNAYYFAGDFNDYVAQDRNYRILGNKSFARFFSYDRPGDITNFYWRFYTPLMEKLLKEARSVMPSEQLASSGASSRITNGKFEILKGGKWSPLTVKGFGLNASVPGENPQAYSRDSTLYQMYLSEMGAAGANCIRAYDLLPPEFYRALREYNLQNKEKIYLVQSIGPPSSVSSGQYIGAGVQEELKKHIALTVDALHGKGVVPKGTESLLYINDISPYILCYISELPFSAEEARALNSSGYSFEGTYLSAAKGAESAIAFFCDYLLEYQKTKYGFFSPVGAKGNAALIGGAPWSPSEDSRLDLASIRSLSSPSAFFLSYALLPDDRIFLDNTASFGGYSDSSGAFAYGGYLDFFKRFLSSHPVLIDRFGFSTPSASFYDEIQSLTEQEQGNQLVRASKTIRSSGFLGGIISDFNDSWTGEPNAFARLNIPSRNDPLWKNVLDPSENRGVYALDAKAPSSVGMSLKDSDRMNEMSISHDESYLYITLLLSKEVDYDKEQLIIGFDTYQRNNGEYLYAPNYYATSLSGMEYILKFESKISAGLYVVPGYNTKKERYLSKESYNGAFDFVSQLRYGVFEKDNCHFYMTGSTLHIRLPWGLLGFTDPSNRLVLNDTRTPAEIAADRFGIQVTATDGIIFSLLIASKETRDTLYLFPLDKQANGYKTYKWEKWEKVSCTFRAKESLSILSKYFKETN